MARTIITKEIEVITCDICGKESEHVFKCQICGRDVCSNCRAWNMCKPCWEDNCSFAMINSETEERHGYGERSHTSIILNHESPAKWRNLLSRFHGKRVKITIEEFPKYEECNIDLKSEYISDRLGMWWI